jgi:hypothetical protein
MAMIKFPKEFPSNIPNLLAGFIALNFGAYFLTFLIAQLMNPGFVKEVGLIVIYTLIFMVLFYGWLVMLVIGLFIWHGQILNNASKIILVAFLGYAGSLLFVTTICIIHWDKHPYRPKIQVRSDKHPQISLVFIDLRKGMGGKNPTILTTQE